MTQYGLTGAQEQCSDTAPGDSCLDALITLIGHNNPAIADSAVNSTINLMEGSKHEQIVSFINRPILCRTIQLLQSSRDAHVRFLHFFRSLIRDGGEHVVSIQEFLLRAFYSEVDLMRWIVPGTDYGLQSRHALVLVKYLCHGTQVNWICPQFSHRRKSWALLRLS